MNTSMHIDLYMPSEKDTSDWIWVVFGLIFGCPQVDLCCDVDNVEELFRFIGRDTPDMLEALEVDEATELDDDILDTFSSSKINSFSFIFKGHDTTTLTKET